MRPAAPAAASPQEPAEPSAASPQPARDLAFRACTRRPATDADTHLTAAQPSRSDVRRTRLEDAVLRREAATVLVLGDGAVRAGNGYEAGSGGNAAVPVAAPGTRVPVTLSVADSARAGRRVAFLELQLSPAAPVRWEEEPRLGILTDGGDGGFTAGDAAPGEVDVDAYVDAFFPGGDNGSGHVCVLRLSGGTVDGVLFGTGFGDGGYPTYVGRDAAGTAVSLVSVGGVLPWSASGLPGTPPDDVDAGLPD